MKGKITPEGNDIEEGEICYKDGRIFNGRISKLNPVEGKMTKGEDYIFEGKYTEKGLPSGNGVLKIRETVYKGNFKNGNLEGEIEYRNESTGESFKGMYSDNKANGYGELSIPKKDLVYKGNFKEGKFEGEGSLLEGKTRYNGNFENGNFTGLGEIHMEESNQIYRGKFIKGELWGEGEYISGKGFTYRGEFKEGAFEGKGEIFYEKDNHVFQGEFLKGKREGFGVIFDEKGEIITQGFWENDVMRDQEEVQSEAMKKKPESSGSFEEFARKVEKEKNSNIQKFMRFDGFLKNNMRFLRKANVRTRNVFMKNLQMRKLFCVGTLGVFAYRNYLNVN